MPFNAAKLSVVAGAGALALLAAPLAVDAHEVRTVGEYEFVVGFLDEPAFAGEKNGLDLRISALGPSTPVAEDEELAGVEDLEETLEAEVIFGDQTMALPLEAAWNDPGAYESFFFPMEPGDYTFRIFGTIDGAEVDESFTSSPEGFNSVQDSAPLRFPAESAAAIESTVVGFFAGGNATGLGAALGGFAAGAAGVAVLARRARG